MLATLTRLEEFSRRPDAPGWIRRTENRTGKPVKPIVRCQCGELVGLADYHLSAEGLVFPAFTHSGDAHTGPGCGWRATLQLADYRDGCFPASR